MKAIRTGLFIRTKLLQEPVVYYAALGLSKAGFLHSLGCLKPEREAGSLSDTSFSFLLCDRNQRGKIPPRKLLCLTGVTSSSATSDRAHTAVSI